MLRTAAFALVLVTLLGGCGRPCARGEALAALDGGPVPCVQATDCPRPANLLVCGSPEDRLRDCLDCVEARCVRYRPEACP